MSHCPIQSLKDTTLHSKATSDEAWHEFYCTHDWESTANGGKITAATKDKDQETLSLPLKSAVVCSEQKVSFFINLNILPLQQLLRQKNPNLYRLLFCLIQNSDSVAVVAPVPSSSTGCNFPPSLAQVLHLVVL
jgi:hypothetical protein